MTISVTAENIAQGEPGKPCACPIALALEREGFQRGMVMPDDDDSDRWIAVWTTADDEDDGCALPPSAVAFARAFDENEPVEPFTFEIDA